MINIVLALRPNSSVKGSVCSAGGPIQPLSSLYQFRNYNNNLTVQLVYLVEMTTHQVWEDLSFVTFPFIKREKIVLNFIKHGNTSTLL